MHLVGYLYEDYHDARSLEHKIFYAACRKYRTKASKCSRAQISQPAILSVYSDHQGESEIKLFLH
jgi:hypothetical protein